MPSPYRNIIEMINIINYFRALPHVVWDYYLNGCSVRLLNPQVIHLIYLFIH